MVTSLSILDCGCKWIWPRLNSNVPAGGNSENTRAGVKAEIPSKGTTGVERGQGPMVNVPTGGNSEKSRAGVKSEISGKGTTGVERGEGPMIDNKSNMTKSNMTSTERKAKRSERKAKAKAKRDANMNSNTSMSKPDMPMKDGKAQ